MLLVHDYAPMLGGAEVVNDTLTRGLRQRGHEVRRLTSLAGLDESSSPGIAPDYACRGTMSRWRTLLQSANPWAPATMRRAIREFAPDVVHVRIYETQLSPLILPLLRGVPSIYHAVWLRAVCPTGNKLLPDQSVCSVRAGTACLASGCLPVHDWAPLMVQMQLARHWRRVFQATIANSNFTAAMLSNNGMVDCTVLPDGVPLRTPRMSLSDGPTAVFVGRLVREKGVDTLLAAFARIALSAGGATLDVIGDGPERMRLQALAAQLGLTSTVRFHGYQSREQCEAIASRAWVQVVPSRWAEPFGLVAAEAMMRGTAVIASASGGLTEIVRHEETGLLVQPNNVDDLESALRRVLGSHGLATRFGEAGRRIALAEYSEDVFVDRVVQVYDRVIDGARALT